MAANSFKDGATLPADLVVMAVGTRHNTALAESAGIRVDLSVMVSDTMQTFDPMIGAVGECVSLRGAAYGLVASCSTWPRRPPTIGPNSASVAIPAR